MALIEAGGLTRQIDLAIFDKDGTLVDFDRLWTSKLAKAVGGVLAQTGPVPGLEAALNRAIGFDGSTGQVVAESPLAVSTLARLEIVCATVLYQHAMPWHRAETLATQHFMPAFLAAPTLEQLALIGDVATLFAVLKRAGVHVAVCTSDNRLPTEAALALLGLAGMVDHIVCGDDPHASKPAPDGILHLARLHGVAPERVLMAGDSAGDMLAGRAAGAGLNLGVLSGTGKADGMAGIADIIMPDIHAIRLAGA